MARPLAEAVAERAYQHDVRHLINVVTALRFEARVPKVAAYAKVKGRADSQGRNDRMEECAVRREERIHTGLRKRRRR